LSSPEPSIPTRLWSGFGAIGEVELLLTTWRREGAASARALLNQLSPHHPQTADPLLHELTLRLQGAPGPRLLVDGIWFSRPHGGITRVWEQVLRCWALPGLLNSAAPVRILERDSHLALVDRFEAIAAEPVDPLKWSVFPKLAVDNYRHAQAWGADVFLSSWISTCGDWSRPVPELALVHDCIPERSSSLNSALRSLRNRWLGGASGFLAVSADTAQDLARWSQRPAGSIPWCHLAPEPLFAERPDHAYEQREWTQLQAHPGLRRPYVLLPATSSIGSYKNPEVVAQALLEPGLEGVQLVLSGLAAATHARAIETHWPSLKQRLVVAGFTDLQLALAYREALAVVLPSRVEGFGLPAMEALAAGATVLLADSRGLREAGGSACPRFHPERPRELAAWLQLLLDPPSLTWLSSRLQPRINWHLQHRNPDLFGLALLAQARLLS